MLNLPLTFVHPRIYILLLHPIEPPPWEVLPPELFHRSSVDALLILPPVRSVNYKFCQFKTLGRDSVNINLVLG